MTVFYILGSFLVGAAVAYFAATKITSLKFDIEKTRLESQLQSALQDKQNAQDFKEAIKEEFSHIANEAIIKNAQSLDEASIKKLDNQLNPLKERILEFQKKVEEFNIAGEKNTTAIKEQISSLTNENNQIRACAENLATALRDNSKTRGIFGEMILESILKTSGMENKKDNPEHGIYITQQGFRSNLNPDGAKITPDAVVYFPEDNKNIVIDSKLSLVDFLSFAEANDDQTKESALKNFYKSIEDRINELSGKYENLEGLATPDFTLMFVPIEASINYIYANQKIIENAYKKGIIIVGPSSLIATLRVVKYSWAQKNQEKNIRDILKLSDGIYSKVVTLITNLEKLQTNFSTVQKGFDGVFTTLKGRGGLFSQTEKLRAFGASPSSTIDTKYLEQNDIELIENP